MVAFLHRSKDCVLTQTEGQREASRPCHPQAVCQIGNQIRRFSQWALHCYHPCTMNMLSYRGIISAERGRVAEWRFFYRIFTKDLEKRRKPNDSKELIHPVDILGFHLGGSSAVVFCTTDSQCVYGTLLSLDLCMFSSQTNLVRNWQMQGVKYWLCLCVRANVAACQCVCVRTCVCVCLFFWLLSWFHLSVLPRRRKPLPSASCSKFLCVPNKRQEVEFKSNFYHHTDR